MTLLVDIPAVWRAVSPNTLLTDEGLRICEAVAMAQRQMCADACNAVAQEFVTRSKDALLTKAGRETYRNAAVGAQSCAHAITGESLLDKKV